MQEEKEEEPAAEAASPETVESIVSEVLKEETAVSEPEKPVISQEIVTPTEDTVRVAFNTEAKVSESKEEEDSYEAIKRRIEESLAQARILVEQEDLLIEDYTGAAPVLNEETGVTFPMPENTEDKS